MKKAFLGSLMGLALAAVACDTATGDASGGAGGTGSTTSATGSTSATTGATTGASMTSSSSGMAAAPTISFEVNPSSMKAGDTIEATVTVENFTLVAPKAQNVDGEGHYHIYLDQQTSYLVAGQTPTIQVKIPAGTAAGPHTLRINLSNNKHAPLNPPVEDVIDITVQP